MKDVPFRSLSLESKTNEPLSVPDLMGLLYLCCE